MLSEKNATIYIAGIARRIKQNNDPPHWRCRINGEAIDHLLMGWDFVGEAVPGNPTQGTNSKAKEDELFAWLDAFGDITIDDKMWATITLKPRPQK